MAYIGKSPPPSALTASDISDGIISEAKLATNSVSEVKMADNELQLEDRKIGPKHPPLVIAENGINHEGNLNKAMQLVDSGQDLQSGFLGVHLRAPISIKDWLKSPIFWEISGFLTIWPNNSQIFFGFFCCVSCSIFRYLIKSRWILPSTIGSGFW